MNVNAINKQLSSIGKTKLKLQELSTLLESQVGGLAEILQNCADADQHLEDGLACFSAAAEEMGKFL